VAVIDYDDAPGWTLGQGWCYLLTDNGHTCTVFPNTGPTGPLDPFDMVIDLSRNWSDPTGMLADCMRAGKTVITWYIAPAVLPQVTQFESKIGLGVGVKADRGAKSSLPLRDLFEVP
jgi:hypothetical protein